MKRTTVMLPDSALARLRRESSRRGTSVAELVREAVELHVPGPEPGARLAFFAIGEARAPDDAARVDEHVGAVVRERASRRS